MGDHLVLELGRQSGDALRALDQVAPLVKTIGDLRRQLVGVRSRCSTNPEVVEFSPTDALGRTMQVVVKNMAEVDAASS
jgi:hypothetical protein